MKPQEVKPIVDVRDLRLLQREGQSELRRQELVEFLTQGLGLSLGAVAEDHESSSPGEFHPQALTDPDVRLAPHPALMIQSPVESRSATDTADAGPVAPADPANGLRCCSDASTVCISGMPNESEHVPG